MSLWRKDGGLTAQIGLSGDGNCQIRAGFPSYAGRIRSLQSKCDCPVRGRFGIPKGNTVQASRLLKEALESGAIIIRDPEAGYRIRTSFARCFTFRATRIIFARCFHFQRGRHLFARCFHFSVAGICLPVVFTSAWPAFVCPLFSLSAWPAFVCPLSSLALPGSCLTTARMTPTPPYAHCGSLGSQRWNPGFSDSASLARASRQVSDHCAASLSSESGFERLRATNPGNHGLPVASPVRL